MHRTRLAIAIVALSCKPAAPGTAPAEPDHARSSPRRGKEQRSYWPASTEQDTFARVGPLPIGHPLAGTFAEARCRSDVEEITGSPRSNPDKASALEGLHGECGDGFAIAWRVGHLYLTEGNKEDAGTWLIKELQGPYAHFVPALRDLGQMLDALTVAHRNALRELGATQEAPMWLPSTELQMGFIAAFVCEGDARYVGQALVEREGQAMDRISYECVGAAAPGARYFALPNMTAILGGG